MLRIRTVWTGVPGTPWYSNLYFTGTTEAEASAAHGLVADAMADLAAYQVAGIDYVVEGEIAELDPVTGNRTGTFDVAAVTGSGTNSGDPVPRAAQIRVRLTTGIFTGGRQVAGAFNLPGVTESANVADGRVDVVTAAAVAGEFTPMIGLDPPALGVWSRKNGTFSLVTNATASTEWAILRSRRD